MGRKHPKLALLLLTVLLTGCWDRTEMEDQFYIIALGLDRGKAEGKIMVTAVVALVQPLRTGEMGGGSRTGLSAQLLTAEADTITQSVHILNGGTSRRLDLRHLRAVVIGEPLARAGVEPLMMELLRMPQTRETVMLAQARGRAYNVLKGNDPVGEINPAKMVEGFVSQAKYLHLAPPVRMHHFLSRLADPSGDPFLPVVAINRGVAQGSGEPRPAGAHESALPGELHRGGGNPLEYIGTAVFRRDRLAGFLNVDETQMLLALRGEMGKAYVTFPDPDVPDQPATLRFHQENLPKYQAVFRGDKPHVTVRLLFEGETLALPGGTDYVPAEVRPELEHAAARYAEQTALGLLEKLKEWEADPVAFGHLFRGRFATWRDWQNYGWRKHVEDLEVAVSVKMRVRRYGLYTGPDRVRGGR